MNKILASLSLIALVACAEEPNLAEIMAANGGVVVAESNFATKQLAQADCAGPALSVISSYTGGQDEFMFGEQAAPCQLADILFNGENQAHTRPPAPGIQIIFQDELGPQPRTHIAQPEPVLLDINLTEATIIDFADSDRAVEITHTATHNGNDIAAKARRWAAIEQSERMLADIRDMNRTATSPELLAHQDKILELQAQLRDLEAENERLHNTKLDEQLTAEELRQTLDTLENQNEMTEDALYAEKRELQRRLSTFEAQNQRMAERNAERERVLTEKLLILEQSLQTSTQEAEAARRGLVLEAAQRIAEAERLAFAAKMSEQQALAQEAARKKIESDVLMDRALALQDGQSVIVPTLAQQLGRGQETNPLPVPLEDLPIVIHVENVTLQELLEEVLTQAAKHAGDWRVSWQLIPERQYILTETWALTAEATVGEVLDFIQSRLFETHNLQITFERFDKVKLLVASDGGVDAVNPALNN